MAAARKRPTMLIPELVQKRMFLLVLFIFLISLYFGVIHTQVHRTLGWQWDIRYRAMIVKNVGWGLFLPVYLLFALLKKDTNKRWSLIHLFLLVCLFIVNQVVFKSDDYELILGILSLIVFFVNIGKSLVSKKS